MVKELFVGYKLMLAPERGNEFAIGSFGSV
jgi:hypothetical protein